VPTRRTPVLTRHDAHTYETEWVIVPE
jgi:hypothetical protein